MKHIRRRKVEQNLQYNMMIRNKNDDFDILNHIIEDVTFLQLMDSLGNVNHAINKLGRWIFYSNYEKELFLHKNHWVLYDSLPLRKN